MPNHIARVEPGIEQIDLFQCDEGCVHFEFGYTMMSFSQENFLYVAELFAEVKKQMLEEMAMNEWAEEILIKEEL